MKNYTPYFLVIAGLFSINSFAQPSEGLLADMATANVQLNSGDMANDLAVVGYRVEEQVHMKFGSNVTTYTVSDLRLVATHDLGPNNTRVVTPKYGKAKVGVHEPQKPIASVVPAGLATVKMNWTAPKEKVKYVNIDILDTYERVLEKGYKSVDMLKRVANDRFFHGNLTKSAKWYGELFAMTSDLEVVFYYRYAKSLEAVGEIAKANEMMKVFESKK